MDLGTILYKKFGPAGPDNPGYMVLKDGTHNNEPYLKLWDEKIMGRPEPTEQELLTWDLELKAIVPVVDAIDSIKAKLALGQDLTNKEIRTALGRLL